MGPRTGMPLLAGFLVGLCVTMVFFSPEEQQTDQLLECAPAKAEQEEFVDVSGDWKVHVDDIPSQATPNDASKVVRARFAATELGMRERLIVLVLAESSLSVSLNASIGRHVPKIHIFVESSRIDADLAQLTNLSPYPLRNVGQKSHHFVLGLIFNMTMHQNYDWYLLMKDYSYVNPFELKRLIDRINWNKPVLIGQPDETGRCRLDSGVLLSNPAMQLLIQNRHACNQIISADDSDQHAFEKCIQLATNLSCTTDYQQSRMNIWRVEGPYAIHDSINSWSKSPAFNQSLIVTKLLSEADSSALHDHFVSVEMESLDRDISTMESEVTDLMKDTAEGPSWPAAIPGYSKPPNRYQVPTWEFFTMKDIFLNEQNQNVRPLEGKDLDDVNEVVSAARAHVAHDEPDLEFVLMRNGYRLFDPRRGMDYMIDLVYKDRNTYETVERRVHLCRLIATTQLVPQVPYVKEDTDITILVNVKEEAEVLPARRLLARHSRLCGEPSEEARKTRLVIAVSQDLDPRSVTNMRNDLVELTRRCQRSALETELLAVHQSTDSGTSPDSIALDECIDRFGSNNIFVVLSPHADIQRDFLNRVRINTIRKYQVFFPVPFVEYHPTIAGMDIPEGAPQNIQQARMVALNKLRDVTPPKRRRVLLVQKDHGRFDRLDFSCVALYGSDYIALRNRTSGKHLDLLSVFLGQRDINVLRAIEPTLRLRYHQRTCDPDLVADDFSRCLSSKRENLAAKEQLAKLLFHEE